MAQQIYKYELVTVLLPKLEEKERDEVIKKIESTLEGNGMAVSEKEHMGNKELAYKIKENKKGDFWIWQLEGENPLSMKTANLVLNREPKIIRYLIIKK